MLDRVGGRILLICIVLALGAAAIIYVLKMPMDSLARVMWVDPEKMEKTVPIPEQFEVEGVEAINQYPEYPTGCESVALTILLRYYGVDVTVEDIVEALPKGPVPYEENGEFYGANPEREFVGDPRESYSFGVYNVPLARTARVFKKGVVAESGVSVRTVKRIVSEGNPVVVWTLSDYSITPQVTSEWKDYETGDEVDWTGYEHAAVVYGYNADSIFISDPYTGEKYAVSLEDFNRGFRCFGQRIVYYKD